METLTLPSTYDSKHALKCLEQEIRQIQGGKITCKQMGKIRLIEKELKALEIIKKYPRCSLQRYIGFNEMVKDGYELTQEHLFNHDMPCSLEEYNIVIEGLL